MGRLKRNLFYYFIYNLFLIAASPLLFAFFIYSGIFDHRYTGTLRERLGRYRRRPDGSGAIWLHAVSVGEAIGATPLIRILLEREAGRPLVVTTTTKTGMEVLQKSFGDRIVIAYFPLDFPWVVRRAFNTFRPSALILMETEIWPNVIMGCRRRGVPVVMLNGRVSDRMAEARGFMKGLYSHVFGWMGALGMQSGKDAERMTGLGAPPEAVHVVGNIKFDGMLTDLDTGKVDELRQTAVPEGARLLLAGSTHPGEEEIILDAFKILKQSVPDLRLAVAPRHIERSEEVADICRAAGFQPALRSTHNVDKPVNAEVIVWNTIGELRYLYSVAAACFVGGSLVERGGHNILEPAACGKAAFYGPYMMNFRASVDVLEGGGGGLCVRDASEFVEQIGKYILDNNIREEMDRRALEVVKKNAGATERAYEMFKRFDEK